MFPPHEIKAKEFTHVLRGYSAPEVDEYAEFVLQKYTELYRENDALENRIKELETELEDYRADDESIRNSLVEANKRSKQIIAEAEERSRIILHSAKINCDRILSEFRSAVSEERDELLLLRGMVKKFKEELFSAYQTHIEYIEKIAPELDELDESEFSDESIIKLVVESIKGDILNGDGAASENSGEPSSDVNSPGEEPGTGDEDGNEEDMAEEPKEPEKSSAEASVGQNAEADGTACETVSDGNTDISQDAEFGCMDDVRDEQLSFDDMFPDGGLRELSDELGSENIEIGEAAVTDISGAEYDDTVNAACDRLADAEKTDFGEADSREEDKKTESHREVSDEAETAFPDAAEAENVSISDGKNDDGSDYYVPSDDAGLGAERMVLHSERSDDFKLETDTDSFSDDDDEFIRSLKSITIEGESGGVKSGTVKSYAPHAESQDSPKKSTAYDGDDTDEYIELINEINASGRKRRRR